MNQNRNRRICNNENKKQVNKKGELYWGDRERIRRAEEMRKAIEKKQAFTLISLSNKIYLYFFVSQAA